MRVMKFGGTSVATADAIRRVAAIVAREHRARRAGPVVVVSALGGVTDRLLEVAALARSGDAAGARRAGGCAARAPPGRPRRAGARRPWRIGPQGRGRPLRAPVGARRRAVGDAGGLAALDGRRGRDGRADELPHRRRGAGRLGPSRRGGGPEGPSRHRRDLHAGRPSARGDARTRGRPRPSACWRIGSS